MGLLAATMLLVVRRGRTVFQVIYFLPVIIATVITARVWQGMIYSPATGIFGLLQHHGIAIVNPLSKTSLALYGVATVDLWHWWGFLCVIFFAALRQVPQEQIEAARIEGATFFQMMRYVLLPGDPADDHPDDDHDNHLVVPGVRLRLHPDPGRSGVQSSEVLSTLAYRKAFYDLNVGQAAAAVGGDQPVRPRRNVFLHPHTDAGR